MYYNNTANQLETSKHKKLYNVNALKIKNQNNLLVLSQKQMDTKVTSLFDYFSHICVCGEGEGEGE